MKEITHAPSRNLRHIYAEGEVRFLNNSLCSAIDVASKEPCVLIILILRKYGNAIAARAEIGEFVEYDLDNEDEDWLDEFNNERKIIMPEKYDKHEISSCYIYRFFSFIVGRSHLSYAISKLLAIF